MSAATGSVRSDATSAPATSTTAALPPAPRVATRTAAWAAVLAVVLLVAATAPVSLISDYQFFQLNRVLTIAIAIGGLNLLLGWAGSISAGHGALFGLGAYATAILVGDHGVPWPLAVLGSLAVGLAVGAVLGLPALRLGGLNLGLVTLAIALVLPPVLNRLVPLTGGAFGKTTPEVVPPAGLPFSSPQWLFLVDLTILALVFWLLSNMLRGRMGRALDAAASSRAMAAAHAVPTNRLTVAVFAVSAGVAALAGGLAHLGARTSTPDSYTFLFSIALITGAVVGGTRSFVGALLGAAFVVLVPELVAGRVDPAKAGQWQQVAYAAALLLVIYFFPTGLAGLPRTIRRLLGRRRPGRSLAQEAQS
ncbi:MAG TPA: branched-chain amino acid ABC transporter permease [Mycobacteriales bacterium]|jgi:branched-chain amino acid transport system permease protein|nr:branched-chain amino acid ABC transporter permease [Mycobacteriales bacterium]